MKANSDFRKTIYLLLAALGVGLFFVTFLWRFFYPDFVMGAIGVNWTIFWILVLGFFVLSNKKHLSKESLLWIIPLVGVMISFGIYKNPFTTLISVLFLPILLYIFSMHERHENIRKSLWSRYFPLVVLFSFFEYLGSVFRMRFLDTLLAKKCSEKSKRRNDIGRQVLLGVGILFFLGVFIIIPLLSGASPAFGDVFKRFFDWLGMLFDSEKVVQLLVWILITLFLMGGAYQWSKSIRSHFSLGDKSPYRQTITVGIVLAGIIALYFLFIGMQLQTLFMRELPINFYDTERTVKSGFWQLFLLTIFNIILFTVIYGRSTKNIHRLLSVFVVSSLLLVASAAQRMYLYVSTYGLSYEKFFALYTVIFCVLVFLWFLWLLFWRVESKNIFQVIGFLALWMYAVSTLFPIEKFILTTNLALTQRPESRVNINELRMLGFDALSTIEKNYKVLIREAEKDFVQAEDMKKTRHLGILKEYNFDKEQWIQEEVYDRWKCWIEENQRGAYAGGYSSCGIDWFDKELENEKRWYEKTLAEMVYTPSKCYMGKCIADLQLMGGEDTKIITWRNPIHGFSLEYPENFFVEYSDKMTESSFLKSEFLMTLRERESKLGKMTLKFFGDSIKNPSEAQTQYRELLRTLKGGRHREVALGRDLSIRGYAISSNGSDENSEKKQYGILVELPSGIMVISSDTLHSAVDLWSVSDDEYVHLVASQEKFADIIYSIEINEVK